MYLREDFKVFQDKSLSKSKLAVLINPSFHTVFLYRLAHFFYSKKMIFISKLLWFINMIVYSVDIDYRAAIGKGFFIAHGIGIVIGHEVQIGEYCSIYQGVTIGGNRGKSIMINNKKISQPIIKDYVTLYSNCMVVGPIIINSNQVVGAMELVTKNIG